MKKLTIKVDQETLRLIGQRTRHWVKEAPQWFFVRHSHVLDLAAVALVLLAGIYLVVVLLYRDPPDLVIPERAEQTLATDAIDRLEFWIEEREGERSGTLQIPQQELFERKTE